jgi:hypothetical protein
MGGHSQEALFYLMKFFENLHFNSKYEIDSICSSIPTSHRTRTSI